MKRSLRKRKREKSEKSGFFTGSEKGVDPIKIRCEWEFHEERSGGKNGGGGV